MKAFYIAYLILAFVLFQSSSETDSSTHIAARLTVVHPLQLYYSTSNERQAFIVDNDGNMYVTKWDLGNKSAAEFEADEKACTKELYQKMILERALDFNEIKEEDIKPSVFKAHGQCIMDRGYTLKEKNSFSPEKFKLSIIRTHAKSSSYIPVGVDFFIVKNHTRYLEAYKQLVLCDAQAKNNDQGVEEEYVEQYIRVSIKPYVDSIKTCFTDAGYTFEPTDE